VPFLFEELARTAGDGASLVGPEFEFIERLRGAAARPPSSLPLLEYFQLCLAAHWATVATFVPTDVDAKIRGLLWRESRDPDTLHAMCDYALSAARWGLSLVSRRTTTADGSGPVSGHNGEWLSVIAGAHGRFLEQKDQTYADKTAAALDAELAREAAAFRTALSRPGAGLDVLRLAASLTHNCGDLDQGISFWHSAEAAQSSRARFHRLAHENRTPYSGAFQSAARLYKSAMAAEGHRHYPLRAARALRRTPDLLLPLAPFLDDWGALISSHPSLSVADRSEVLAALVSGCGKIPNQFGYFRALAGFATADPRGFDDAASRLPAALRKDLRDLRKRIDVPRISFESMMSKKVATVRYTGSINAV
jgi:hypothetical protein